METTPFTLPERWAANGLGGVCRYSASGVMLGCATQDAAGWTATYIDRRTREQDQLVTGVELSEAVEAVEARIVAIAEGRA